MTLRHYTLKPLILCKRDISQIHKLIEKVVSKREDEYWKNYKDYSVFDQHAITISYDDNDDIRAFSSIYNREFYGDGVYRIMNRWLIDDEIRETGGSKTYGGEHRFFDMIYQQIEYIKPRAKFYFMSRQRKNTKWLRWYFDRFNKQYDTDLIVSDKQYMVCNGSEYDCSQTLIYPKDKIVPFKSYK